MLENAHSRHREKDNGFKRALEHYQAGEVHEAERICKEICHVDPDYSPALHLLGMIAYRTGLNDIAVKQLCKAVQISPDIPFFHNDLGNVFLGQGKIDEAILCYRNALKLEPNILQTYYHLGVALRKKDLLDDALRSFEILLKLKPGYTDALYQAGCILSQKDRQDEAILCFEKLLESEPSRQEALFALGVALGAVGRAEEALICYRKVLETEPNHLYALNNIGFLLKEQGDIEQAMEAYQKAIEISPDSVGPHWNLSHVLLLGGNLQAGWKEFEWRLRKNDWKKANFRSCVVPLWRGEPFTGKTLFIHDEQGLGDTIQFIRYLPMVKALGGDVIFETQKPLIGILENFLGIDRLISQSEGSVLPTDMDFYAPLLSLPAIFNTTLNTIPDTVPYLHADADKAEYWKKRLQGDGIKVGIVWAGGPKNPNDQNRSCRLRQFESVANIDGVRLIGIQKGQAAEQVWDLPPSIQVINYGPELEDFTATMALIENLDLVIAVDTAVAHLAGAMGKPVWLILTFAHHWPWLLNRTDSPWYPSMRIYRQKKKGDWEPVFKQIEKDLRARITKRGLARKSRKLTIPFNKTKSCRHGVMCYNQNDMYIGKSFDLYGEFSEGEITLFRSIATKGSVILDIGANIGAHTLFLAKAVGPKGQVHAFEPQRIVFQNLCANMALNHISNAFCYNMALGKSPGTVLVPQIRPWEHFNFGGLSLGNHQLGEVVEVKTVDSLQLSACSFIKIDAEGMEFDVLEGAANTIRTLQPILYVENDRKDKSDALIKLINSLRYDMYWHKPPLYNPENFFKNPENVFGDIVSLNMICLPRSRGGVLQKYERVFVPE